MARVVVWVVGLSLIAGSVYAQDRRFATVDTGVTFGTETSASLSGTVGAPLSRHLHAIGEVGYFWNVTPKDVQDEANAISLLASSPGQILSVDVSAPAFYALAGLRATVPTRSAVRPYVQGGIGFAHINAKLDFFLNGNNINSLLVSNGFVNRSDLEASDTKGLFNLGGGVQIGVGSSGRMIVDAAYRYYHISLETAANVSRASVGFGVRF